MTPHKIVLPLLLGLALHSAAQAQTAPKGKDKVQTREELRACMKLKDQVAAKAADLDKRKAAHEAGRAEVRGQTDQIKAFKGEVDLAMEAYKAANAELAAHVKLIDRWNDEVREVDASTMKSAERRKAALKKERVSLDARNTELVQQRDEKVKAYEETVARYNARVAEGQAKVDAWNATGTALSEEGDKLTDLRLDYAENCANRRFKEEDEEAIRKGR